MDFDMLSGLGVRVDLVAAWQKALGPKLLPIQERAVMMGLLMGKNLIISSPTSGGKTAVGEIAAAKAARDGKQVFFLVPLKAVAEEKYRDFRERYAPLGIEVVVSTRDYGQFDERILANKYHLAIATYEKLDALLAAKPELASSIGLVVVDELQMLADPERGGTLEILLTKIRRSRPQPQILGLSAVLERTEDLARWLGAEAVVEPSRPVELRKGILLNGVLHFKEHNSGVEGTERHFEFEPGAHENRDYREDLTLQAVRHFVQVLKEPTLVFVPDKRTALSMAQKCSRLVQLPTCEEALVELKELEECEAQDALADLLSNGVAFHHADLALGYRTLVERHFRSGGIRLIFSTSTLAMGVNLPARNVILIPSGWRNDERFGLVMKPLTKMEFENYAGRAARLGYGDPFGRAMICETSDFQKDVLLDRYIRAPFEPLVPALLGASLEEPLLELVSSGLVKTKEDLKRFFGATLSGAALLDRVEEALGRLSQGRLIEISGDLIVPTDLGRAVASRGLRCATGAAIFEWARAHKGLLGLELLIALARTPDGIQFYVGMTEREVMGHKYEDLLKGVVPRHELLGGDMALGRAPSEALKKSFVLHDWIEERPLREIERDHLVWGGTIERLGDEYAWLVEASVRVAALANWSPDEQEGLRRFARRLRSGVSEELLPLAPARRSHLSRALLRKLWTSGFATMEDLRAAPIERLREVIGPRAANRLHAWLHHTAVATPPSSPRKPQPSPPNVKVTASVSTVAQRPRAPKKPIRLVLTGELHPRGKVSTLLDGAEYLVTRRHFGILIALARKKWLALGEVDNNIDFARIEILRLRRILAKALGVRPDEVFLTDGRKRYRLLVPMRVRWAAVRKHQPDLPAQRPGA